MLEANLLNGDTFQSSDMNGKYVLLDFWGSWCAPCRRENPELVALNKEYSGQDFANATDFSIVSIAIETNEKAWKRAIEKDQLNWPYHIVQLDRFSSPLAKMYGVKEIPTKYLLDTNGEVLMVNPSFMEIRQFLDSKIQS